MPRPKLTTGLDVSDRYSTLFTLDADGEVEEAGRIRTTSGALRVYFEGPRRRVILEAGPHSPWISRLLADLGQEVIAANARMVAQHIVSKIQCLHLPHPRPLPDLSGQAGALPRPGPATAWPIGPWRRSASRCTYRAIARWAELPPPW